MTMMGMPHSSSISKPTEHDETPERNKPGKTKKRGGGEEEEVVSLPPIHQLRLDVKLNLYGATTKTHNNVFKQTLANMNKRKDDAFLGGINGKKMDR